MNKKFKPIAWVFGLFLLIGCQKSQELVVLTEVVNSIVERGMFLRNMRENQIRVDSGWAYVLDTLDGELTDFFKFCDYKNLKAKEVSEKGKKQYRLTVESEIDECNQFYFLFDKDSMFVLNSFGRIGSDILPADYWKNRIQKESIPNAPR